MTHEEKFEKMTTEPVASLLVKLAIPTILSMLVTTFYNAADTFFVGKINTEATSAVGVAMPLMAIIQACGFMFGHGSGNFLARKLGEKRDEEAGTIANAGFFFALSFGLVMGALGFAFPDFVSNLLGSPKEALSYTSAYIRPIFVATPFMMGSIVLNNEIRYQGNAKTAMWGIMSGAIINMGLDPLLMFVFDMGIQGAAVATAISQFISFVLLLITTRFAGNIKITVKKNPFAFKYLGEIISGGLPSLFRQGLASISTLVLNVMAKKVVGEVDAVAAIAAMTIVSKVTMFTNSTVIGFGQGFQPVCSFNYGAMKYKRVKEAFLFSVKVCAAFLLVACVMCFAFAPEVVGFFRKGDPMVTEIGTFALRAQCITFVLGAWIILTNMLLQASGQAFWATFISSCRSGLCFIPTILVLANTMGLRGVQISQAVADVMAFGISLYGGIRFLKKLEKTVL